MSDTLWPERSGLAGYRLQNALASNQPSRSYRLREAVIVGCFFDQAKFGEFTVDACRFAKALEYEVTDSDCLDYRSLNETESRRSGYSMHSASSFGTSNKWGRDSQVNPHKTILYKPTYGHISVALANAFDSIGARDVMLVYFSCESGISKCKADESLCFIGLRTNYAGIGDVNIERTKTSRYADQNCFYREDIYPFTRKPLLLVVDSPASDQFDQIKMSVFGQPFVSILSPTSVPDNLNYKRFNGQLMTLFLTCPLIAMCAVCQYHPEENALSKDDVQYKMTIECAQTQIADTLSLIQSELDKTNIGFGYFMSDPLLASILTRFAFYLMVTQIDKRFKLASHRPRSNPRLDNDLLANSNIRRSVLGVCSTLRSESLLDVQK